jgi:hypothetical protein
MIVAVNALLRIMSAKPDLEFHARIDSPPVFSYSVAPEGARGLTRTKIR